MSAAPAQPGRSCPLAYRYGAQALRCSPELHVDTLLIAGGLYGNAQALDALLAMAADEPGGATVVFNGDFHWFDIDPAVFAHVNRVVLSHVALRGNVETELATGTDGAGCGCGYPEWVGDAEVARSNAIMARLQQTAQSDGPALQRLAALPMHRVVEVGGERIGLVHGDAESLAGWECSREMLRDHPARVARQLELAGVRVLATSHTCLPVLAEFGIAGGRALLANNGAAGMPNFAGSNHGVVTRISVRPARRRIHGIRAGAVHVDAVALEYDHAAWLAEFDRCWPVGSTAQLSYRQRIVSGPDYAYGDALHPLLTAVQ